MITGHEGVSFDIEGKVIPDSVGQGTGTMVVEQHGSLLKAIDTSDGEEIHLGSTLGNNIILTNGGYAEVPGMGEIRFESVGNGTIEKGANGLEIYMNWVWHLYDSDNNLISNSVGTQIWEWLE